MNIPKHESKLPKKKPSGRPLAEDKRLEHCANVSNHELHDAPPPFNGAEMYFQLFSRAIDKGRWCFCHRHFTCPSSSPSKATAPTCPPTPTTDTRSYYSPWGTERQGLVSWPQGPSPLSPQEERAPASGAGLLRTFRVPAARRDPTTYQGS